MYAVIVIIVMIIIVIIIIIIIQEKWCCATLGGPLTIHCTYLIATFLVTPSLSLAQGKFGSLPAVLDSNLCCLCSVCPACGLYGYLWTCTCIVASLNSSRTALDTFSSKVTSWNTSLVENCKRNEVLKMCNWFQSYMCIYHQKIVHERLGEFVL